MIGKVVSTFKWSPQMIRHFRMYRGPIGHFQRGKSFISFDNLIWRRRSEAQRSLLVEVENQQSMYDLYKVCGEFGKVKHMFSYSLKEHHTPRNMVLIEYEDLSSLEKVLRDTSCFFHEDYTPVQTPFVSIKKQNTENHKDDDKSIPLVCEREFNERHALIKLKKYCNDISTQIQLLYSYLSLKELDYRLRFFTCRQIEIALSGPFLRANIFPFGSSINGFGDSGCDLDMVLDLANGVNPRGTNQRLVFKHNKSEFPGNPRFLMQKHLDCIASIIRNFVPECTQVRKILNARVPIIKYCHEPTKLDCDLSMGNRTGYFMSEMLYLYGCMDYRVQPLVFAIRYWAKCKKLTSDLPGPYITNFSITQLVLFFLMRTSPPVIPNFEILINLAGKSDFRETQDINCTFLRDISNLAPSENKESLESLFINFFNFYAKFNFKTNAISIHKGIELKKEINGKPLYVQNPLERNLNVSRNINDEELEHLVAEILNAQEVMNRSIREVKKGQLYGFLFLIKSRIEELKLDFLKLNMEDLVDLKIESGKSSVMVDEDLMNSQSHVANKKYNRKKTRHHVNKWLKTVG